MKKIFLLFTISLLIYSTIISQNKLTLNLGVGYYLSNSENDTHIMGNNTFTSYFISGFSYQRENLFGINLELEYNFHKMVEKNTVIFIRRNQTTPSTSIGGDMSLINHTLDFSYIGKLGNLFSYGIGPSFIITNRIFEVEGIQPQYKTPLLYDKLASSSLGLNGFIDIQIPFTDEENYFYFTSKLKLRYTYSIWFDKGIRKLDDYYQEFFTSELSIGVGYSF